MPKPAALAADNTPKLRPRPALWQKFSRAPSICACQIEVLLHALLRAEQHSLTFRRHCNAWASLELGVPVRQPLAIKLSHFDAVTFRVDLKRLGQRCLKLVCGLGSPTRRRFADARHRILTRTGVNCSC